jgi:hypothetical protein
MKKLKRSLIPILFLLPLIVLAVLTNPKNQDYIQFTEAKTGEPFPNTKAVEIERVNFYAFSTYTPMVRNESGMTHLGIFGNFYQISEGQYDYPLWLELFN